MTDKQGKSTIDQLHAATEGYRRLIAPMKPFLDAEQKIQERNRDLTEGVTKAIGLPVPSLLHSPPPAERAAQKLGEQIAEFESGLSSEEEVGAVIIGAPGNEAFHITRFEWIGGDILAFEGVNTHGRPCRLVQHVSQLSILLTALPKLGETARRIGFMADLDSPDGSP